MRLTPKQQSRLEQAARAHAEGDLSKAESGYRALIAKNVRHPELYCRLAQICAMSARRDEADALWRRALAIDPRSIDARMNLADSDQLAGDLDKAADTYRRVIKDHDQFFIARYTLGNVLKAQGKLQEARDQYQKVMVQQPDYTQAHFTYSTIHKYENRSDPHIDAMLELLARVDLTTEQKIHLEFGLAKAFEDIADYAEAFSHLESGNALRFAEFNYDIESDKALIESIIQAFSKDAMSRVQVEANTSRRPIFIVGMPRSGTSLVEKIIASHSEVYGAGELEDMFALGASHFLNESNSFQFERLDAYAVDTFSRVGTSYLERLAQLNDEAERVTDKMPFNGMMLGIIRLALPNAKIIHCTRDARDTCLSIFKQNFTTRNYRFAYDQKTVAQFHNLYTKLMEHWHETMPGVIYDISYEALTRNPEHEIPALLEACDLEFQEQCMTFDKTEAVVKTASAFQVRQPMYTSSVGLWRAYEPFLGALLAELR